MLRVLSAIAPFEHCSPSGSQQMCCSQSEEGAVAVTVGEDARRKSMSRSGPVVTEIFGML